MAALKMDAADVNAWQKAHHDLGIPFTLTVSNYTTEISSTWQQLKFAKNMQGTKMFSAYNRIKKDVTRFPVPAIRESDLTYFRSALTEGGFYADTIYNIDLKAAYVTVLLVDGFISQQTYEYVMSLPKMQRLAAAGMLAGKKHVFGISDAGEILDSKITVKDTAPYFYHCVQRTAEIMNEAAQILGDAFLFTWVDGIYFLDKSDNYNEANAIAVGDFLTKKGFRATTEMLTEFEVTSAPDYFTASYLKEGKPKSIIVPKQDSSTLKKIVAYLLQKDYQTKNKKK